MTRLNKDELRNLIKEVLQERWIDFFRIPGAPARKEKDNEKKYDLYTDVEEWEEDMLDVNGRYIGPTFAYYGTAGKHFENALKKAQPGEYEMFDAVRWWNWAVADELGIPFAELDKVNKELLNNFYSEVPPESAWDRVAH